MNTVYTEDNVTFHAHEGCMTLADFEVKVGDVVGQPKL